MPAYPYSLMGYNPYSPYLQMPTMMAAAQNGSQTAAMGPSQALPPGYAAAANYSSTNNILTQSYAPPAAAVLPQGTPVLPPTPTTALKVDNGVPPAAACNRVPAAAEEGGGADVPADKDEYIQELMKERDNIESSSVSNLSKSHVLRLLNQGMRP